MTAVQQRKEVVFKTVSCRPLQGSTDGTSLKLQVSGASFSLPKQRDGGGWGRRPRVGPPAAVRGLCTASLGLSGALRWRVDPVDLEARRMFENIDTAGKGHITEDDLREYAAAQGLPAAYVRPFLEALTAAPPGDDSGSETGGDAAAAVAEAAAVASGGARAVGFRRFRRFVVAREQGLREAFDMFDRDRDGEISPEDLDLSLQHVTITCPSTRCVLRCRQQVISQLVARIDADASQSISFDEFRQYFTLLPQNDAAMIQEYWLGPSAAGSCADMGTRVAVQEGTRRGSPWGHLFAGAIAGAVSRTATAPLETLRLTAMAGGLPPGGRLDVVASSIVAEHGWRALYKGNAVNVMRSAPQKALDFFMFDGFKALLSGGGPWRQQQQQQQQLVFTTTTAAGSSSIGKPCGAGLPCNAAVQSTTTSGSGSLCSGGPQEPSLGQTLLAAGLAGSTSCLLLHPLDVARTRLTLDAAGRYSGLADCLRTIVRTEGAGALLRGLGPSVAAIFPEAAITYGLHDLLKRAYRRVRHRDPGIGASLAAGVLSASMGQLVAYPLETISRRMQLGALPATPAAAAAAGGAAAAAALHIPAAAGAGGPGALQIATQIVKEGGVRALYAGWGAATLRLVPMAIVSFGVYEAMRAGLLQVEAQWDRHVAELQLEQLHGQSTGGATGVAMPSSAAAAPAAGGGGAALAAGSPTTTYGASAAAPALSPLQAAAAAGAAVGVAAVAARGRPATAGDKQQQTQQQGGARGAPWWRRLLRLGARGGGSRQRGGGGGSGAPSGSGQQGALLHQPLLAAGLMGGTLDACCTAMGAPEAAPAAAAGGRVAGMAAAAGAAAALAPSPCNSPRAAVRGGRR